MEFQPEGLGRRQRRARLGLGLIGAGRIDQQRHDALRGDQLVQQLQPLRRYLLVYLSHARDVAARMVKVGDEAELDRIGTRFKDYRNGRGRRLSRKRCRGSGCGNHGHLTMKQIGRQRWQPIVLAICPAVFDRHVLTIHVSRLA